MRRPIDQALALERAQAAIGAGFTPEAEVGALYAAFDKNGNGILCVQLPNGFEVNQAPFARYLYSFSDDLLVGKGTPRTG